MKKTKDGWLMSDNEKEQLDHVEYAVRALITALIDREYYPLQVWDRERGKNWFPHIEKSHDRV